MASSGGGGEGATAQTNRTIHTASTAKDSHTYFFEDEVYTVDKRGRVKFGVIVSSGTISDEDDEDYVDPGKVRVSMHPDGKENVLPVSQVGLVDRTLAPGDVVRRLDAGSNRGQSKQFGYCQEMTVSADMNVVGTNFVIKNVPAKRCAPLHRMTTGAVLLDSWIGVSDMIKEKLVLQTSCGSLIEVVLCADQSPLWDIEDNPRGSYFSTPTFHVGQILVGPVAALENATWLYTSPEMRGSRKNKTVNRKFIVQSVELHEVTIYWQIKPNVEVNSLDEISYSEPPKVVRGEDLKRIQPMNVFEEAMLQINDKHHVTIQEQDEVISRHEWKKELGHRYQLPRSVHKSPNRNPRVGVKVVVSGEGEEKKHENVFLMPAIPQQPTADSNYRQSSLKPPPVTRGHSLGKLEGEQKHHSQFLTVTADTRRSHSLDAAAGDSDATTEDLTDDLEGEETSASGSEFSSNTPSSCSTTPRGSPKASPLLANKLRRLQKQRRKKRHEKKRDEEPPVKVPEQGQTVVVRALVVYSTVTVLWQDGTLETDIPSRELFPMHTLDHHEFFPSDFVLHATADRDTEDWHNYGVIQTMDHVGRLARVKWFETAKAYDQDPKFKGETEVSVYDLKDHLQFQYRPGTIVVRLRKRSADGQGEDAEDEDPDEADGGQLGQVIDNSPEGKVKVVWVNKKVSSCWPQDIFELGNYDSGMFISHDHLSFGDMDDGGAGGADDSWMTESEESHLGDESTSQRMKPADRAYLSELLERLKASLVRLKTLFKMNPQIFSGNVVQELMVIFKKCRYFDRLMNTQFFSEENFEGLVERVRKTAALGQTTRSNTSGAIVAMADEEVACDEENAPFLNASHSTPIKGRRHQERAAEEELEDEEEDNERSKSPMKLMAVNRWPVIPNKLDVHQEDEKRQTIKKGDSGHYSEMDEDHSSESSSSAMEGKNNNNNFLNHPKATVLTMPASPSSIAPPSTGDGAVATIPMDAMCSKFCNLLMEQMSKAFHEINTVYCNPSSEWEVVKEESATDIARQLDESNATDAEDLLNTSDAQQEEGIPMAPPESFLVVDATPTSHQFNLSLLQPKLPKVFFRAVKREHDMLRTGLPEGVWVRAYEERLDLFSVMIEGPKKTPYEDGVFLFDIQLGSEYPDEPPSCHYISYCHDRLNPNLYEEGRVCVSLLGTWTGKGTEKWGTNSSLLQLIVSIQGLILVAEPYFNEAGYEKQVGSQQGCENSQIYNEMVVIKLLQSMMKLLEAPPEIFRERILNHFKRRGQGMIERIRGWVALSREEAKVQAADVKSDVGEGVPDFPLVPASRGFCMTVESLLGRFKQVIERL